MTPADKFAKKKPRRVPSGARGAGKLPNRLRELREALNLSLRDVEAATGIKNPTIYTAECGCEVNLSTAMALARFYGRSVEWVWKIALLTTKKNPGAAFDSHTRR